ncbi:MAG TPA: HNH endonuclease [Gammaproteobacteria bacterium]|nr:HNH endonuclease [Gammaproteobacteria bacterium]
MQQALKRGKNMIPIKPFDTYKWRWLSVAPTESLLSPPVLLGVLRVLARHEGQPPSAPNITDELRKVQTDTKTTVNLARTANRNIIRNSGQYWKGTGLLTPDRGVIHLTSLGQSLASGQVTQGEFAALMIQQTVLPNTWTYTSDEIMKWKAANLEIRPLALILAIITELGIHHGNGKEAFLTPHELIQIVIPLAGTKKSPTEIAGYLAKYRQGALDISAWPNCAPDANDRRLAREFLLFLSNFGVCRKVEKDRKLNERYYLDELCDNAALQAGTSASIFTDAKSSQEAIEVVRHSPLPSIIERQRTSITILRRLNQAKFRTIVLKKYSGRCFLTGEEIPEVLEAAHIIPVEHGGADSSDNGICLRSDIHRLFDSGNIRIKPTGELKFSDVVVASKNYSALPPKIIIPGFVNPVNIDWRDAYY